MGLVAAVALAGCGGSGNVAEKISTAAAGGSGTRPAVTETREAAATEAESQSLATVTETQPAATVTETSPASTVARSATVAVTVTGSVQTTPQTTAVPPATTTATSSTEADGTSPWVWVLVGVGAAVLVALVFWLLRRGSKSRLREEQERAVAATVAGWTAQGWAIESQASSGAMLRRHDERVAVTVEPDGSITSRRLAAPDDAPPLTPTA